MSPNTEATLLSQWTSERLQAAASLTLSRSELDELIQAYRAALPELLHPERAQQHILLAQMNPSPGDLKGNMAQIAHWMTLGSTLGVGWVVFPELALMGYPIRDVITRHRFLVDENVAWLKILAKQTKLESPTLALVGFVEPRPAQSTGKPFYNAAAIIGQGTIQGIVRKSLLPTYNEFEDVRTFEPSPMPGVYPAEALGCDAGTTPPSPTFQAHGREVGIVICEDGWNVPGFFAHHRYHQNPLDAMMTAKPDLLINLSASPSRARKPQLRRALLAHTAKHYQVPVVYVNQVGAVDECSFDGGSTVFNDQGECIAEAELFSPTALLINPAWSPPSQETKTVDSLEPPKTFNLDESSPMAQAELKRTYQSVCQGIRDYFAKTGFKRAVLGLSGGLDSSVTAVLLAHSLGADNVLGVSMPSTITPVINQSDAKQLATNLGIHFIEQPIAEMLTSMEPIRQSYQQALHTTWEKTNPHSAAGENLQAMTRATLLRVIGNDFDALPIATSDKSELYLGYATVNGDMSGALAPLGDIPKTKVFALGRWLNHEFQEEWIPSGILQRPPSADLSVDPATGQSISAESTLMPYAFADEVIWRLEVRNQSYEQMLVESFQYETTAPITTEQKQAWLQKFFRRMAAAVFKWWLIPPIIIVSGNGSITKTDYHHPITASRIDWCGLTDEEKEALLAQWLH